MLKISQNYREKNEKDPLTIFDEIKRLILWRLCQNKLFFVYDIVEYSIFVFISFVGCDTLIYITES